MRKIKRTMMNKVARELAKQAKVKGICEEWHKQLKDLTDKHDMVDMYIRGIDFCLSNEFPGNEYIRKNFKGIMEEQGVFLDDNITLVNFRRCVALGTTKGSIKTTLYKVCEVFAKHESRLNVIAEDNAFVEIDMFDNSVVSVVSSGKAKVYINHYGGNITINEQGESTIKIVEKNKKTY